MNKAIVTRSIEAPGGQLCVDLLREADGTWSFAEFRRDPEDPRGWFPTGLASSEPFRTEEAAFDAARLAILWLANPDRVGMDGAPGIEPGQE